LHGTSFQAAWHAAEGGRLHGILTPEHALRSYSDHTTGTEAAVAAVAMGACCIEKHFTIDKTMEGPDHQASLEPAELAVGDPNCSTAALRH
jgi:hypothetical protein